MNRRKLATPGAVGSEAAGAGGAGGLPVAWGRGRRRAGPPEACGGVAESLELDKVRSAACSRTS